MQSEALVIRQDAPNPINRLPNLRIGQKILGHESLKKQLNRVRRGSAGHKVANVPPIAYTVMGHGNESAIYKTVPPGCILVVPTNSGNSVTATTAIQNNLKLLDEANKQYILDPLNHKKEIYKLFGPVTIFTEGELYPDFSYSLLSYYKALSLDNAFGQTRKYTTFKTSGFTRISPDVPVDPLLIRSLENDYRVLHRILQTHMLPFSPQNMDGSVKLINEGLMKVPLLLVDGRKLDLEKIKAADPDKIAEIFKKNPTRLYFEAERIIRQINLPNLFKFSNVPEVLTSEDVQKEIDADLIQYKIVRPRPNSVDLDVHDYIKFFLADELLDFTQMGLFEKAGPGVYYNFICRSNNSDIPNPFKLKASNLQRVSEAATHRSIFMHNVFKNSHKGAGRKTRRLRK